MSRDTNTDDRIKRAAQEALDTKYSWAEDWDDAASDHEFSEAFLKKWIRPAALLSTAMSAWDASA